MFECHIPIFRTGQSDINYSHNVEPRVMFINTLMVMSTGVYFQQGNVFSKI